MVLTQVLNIFLDRLARQLRLVEDTIQNNNYKAIKQESKSLERMYSDFTHSYTNLLEYSQEVGLPKDIEDIVTLDEKVFEAKERVCLWLSSRDNSSST